MRKMKAKILERCLERITIKVSREYRCNLKAVMLCQFTRGAMLMYQLSVETQCTAHLLSARHKMLFEERLGGEERRLMHLVSDR